MKDKNKPNSCEIIWSNRCAYTEPHYCISFRCRQGFSFFFRLPLNSLCSSVVYRRRHYYLAHMRYQCIHQKRKTHLSGTLSSMAPSGASNKRSQTMHREFHSTYGFYPLSQCFSIRSARPFGRCCRMFRYKINEPFPPLDSRSRRRFFMIYATRIPALPVRLFSSYLRLCSMQNNITCITAHRAHCQNIRFRLKMQRHINNELIYVKIIANFSVTGATAFTPIAPSSRSHQLEIFQIDKKISP